MHSLCIAALALSTFALPAPDIWASSELLHDVAIQEPPSADTGADGPFNDSKPQPQPTQSWFGWLNNRPNNNANRPQPTNTNAPELTWNHEKGILELEGPKTVPPADYAPAQNPIQTIAPTPNPYYPPAPPPAQEQPKTPTGWDMPLATGGPGMADMKHDMPKPAVYPPATAILPRFPEQQQQPKTPTGWDLPLVTTGAGMAGMADMNHNTSPAPTPMPAPPIPEGAGVTPPPGFDAELAPQLLVPAANYVAPVNAAA